MLRSRPVLPHGHGEVLTDPPFPEWARIAEENHAMAESWAFRVGDSSATDVRQRARADAIRAAGAFSARMGIPTQSAREDPDLVIVTGHQPQLFHPGVWIKHFLLQRECDETGATGVDLVVDTDSFESVALTVPCLGPEVMKCSIELASGGRDRCFACEPIPSTGDVDRFCSDGVAALAGLPSTALTHHFSDFCAAVRSSAADAENLAELMTFARRRYEAPAGTDYLELPTTALGDTEAFRSFLAHIVLDAERFAGIYNGELGAYRAAHRVRTNAQPFPDCALGPGRIELPFWVIDDGGRRTLAVSPGQGEIVLRADDDALVACSPDPASLIATLTGLDAQIAPKALALTLFARLFLADLFIHGVGGSRYDHVTDGVIRSFFGVKPPAYVVASMTMYLPLGGQIVGDEEVAAAKQDLQRLTHNPDSLLAEADFDSPEEAARAVALAEEKSRLVAEIAEPGADKKALGERIRSLNAEIAEIMAPLADEYERRVAALESQRRATAILTDRDYPYCLWSPLEIQDKAR